MQYTPEMKQLAEAVLKDQDATAVAALCDCIRENLTYTDTKFNKAHVERIEGLLRQWRKNLYTIRSMTAYAASQVGIRQEVDDMLIQYSALELTTRQQFGRDLL